MIEKIDVKKVIKKRIKLFAKYEEAAFGTSFTRVSPSNPDPKTKDNESEKFNIEIENNSKINLRTINSVFIPSNNLVPIVIKKIGIKYAANPKKTNTILEISAK